MSGKCRGTVAIISPDQHWPAPCTDIDGDYVLDEQGNSSNVDFEIWFGMRPANPLPRILVGRPKSTLLTMYAQVAVSFFSSVLFLVNAEPTRSLPYEMLITRLERR